MVPFLVEIEGYRARVERDRDGTLWGRVIEIDDVITFKASTMRVVESRFAKALGAYFERCLQQGIKPQKPGEKAVRFNRQY